MLYYSHSCCHRWFIPSVCQAFLISCAHSCHSLIISLYHFIVRLSSVSYFDVGCFFFFAFLFSIDVWFKSACGLCHIGSSKRKRAADTLILETRAHYEHSLINEQNENSIEKYVGNVPNDLFRAHSVRWRMQQVVSSVFI